MWNGERYLEGALDAILAQDCGDFELVISDNASEDGTEAICRRYAARDPRIRYERQPANRGGAWNFDRVLQLAAGRFFKWATHDDLIAPTFLSRTLREFAAAPASVVLVYPRTALIGPDGETLEIYDDRLDLRQPSPVARLTALVRNVRLVNALLGLIRSDALRATAGYRGYTGSDNVLLAELALRGEFREVPEVLHYRRLHPEASTRVYRGLRARMRWLAPESRSLASAFPVTRIAVEHLRAIRRAPLSRLERARAVSAYLPAHLYARGRHRTAQLIQAARRARAALRRAPRAL